MSFKESSVTAVSPQYLGGDFEISSDLACESPVYIYWPHDKSILLYSKSINALLSDTRICKPLNVSSEAISFLLQSGVVPPPKTAYEDIYILGIGHRAKVSTCNGKVDVEFSHEFPFLNCDRLKPDEMQPDEDTILELLAEATISRIGLPRQSFLFHSAGKDSNSIALALAEAGWQDKVTLITHKSKGKTDESGISKNIANQLGFKHEILHEIDRFGPEHKKIVNDYFYSSIFPSTDDVTLAYPLYRYQMPSLHGANIIDGMGNDVYIGHIPSNNEFKRQKYSKYAKRTRILTKHLPSESILHVAGRTRSEITGLSGLSFNDAKVIYDACVDVSKFWSVKDTNQDYLDFRSTIRGTIIDQEVFIRKSRNFADFTQGNLILPWTNPKVAKYFSKVPEIYLFDKLALRNKLVLRDLLKSRMGLDSDMLGKLGFSYDFSSVVINNLQFMVNEILSCNLWKTSGCKVLINHFSKNAQRLDRKGAISRNLIYRIYLISAWYNNNRYIAP